jgi:MFS family permease
VTELARSLQIFRSAMRNGSLRRVLVAFFLFTAQEYAVWIAVIVYAFERGGAPAAGAVVVAQLLPAALAAPFTSTLGDRLRRDRALTLGYAIQACACSLLALALWKAPPLLAYVTAAVANCAITFTRPTHNAILADLADTPEELTAANAATGMVEGLGTFVGPALNAILIVSFGPAGVVGVMVFAMIAAAWLSLRLRLHRDTHQMARAGPGSFIDDAVGGIRELRSEPGAPLLLFVGGSQFFLIGLLDIFYALLAIEILEVGSSGAGALAAGYGLGGLVGATVAVALAGRRRLSVAMVGGLLACGATVAMVGLAGSIAGALVLLALCGAARAFFDVAARTLLQRAVREDVLARVFGLEEALQMGGLAVGSAAAPLLVSTFGPRGAFVASGATLAAIAIGTSPRLRQVDARAHVPGPELGLLRNIPIFAPLAEHVAERLSWDLVPLDAAAGTIVIREGDEGDRFYVIADGEAEVITAGRAVARLGPGSYFGEIALLRDVPRTATVKAVTDCRLLSLERDVFLSALTGSSRSLETADREIDRRLDDLEDR